MILSNVYWVYSFHGKTYLICSNDMLKMRPSSMNLGMHMRSSGILLILSTDQVVPGILTWTQTI